MVHGEESGPVSEPREGCVVIEDATCTQCGCVCDDIDLTVVGQKIVAAERACPLGERWFFGHSGKAGPACLIRGQEASIADGIERAAQVLVRAKYPLVFGLAETTAEAQRSAVAIADWLGGNIDSTTSIYHGPSGMAFEGVGEVTATLGEVCNRGDLIVFWGSDPVKSHPRHFSKYSLYPRGLFVPGGRRDRTAVVVDTEFTESAREADLFLRIKPGADFEGLWVLRALASDIEVDRAVVEQDTGVSLATWQDLMARMKRARFGALFFGAGLTLTRGRHVNGEAALALTRDMNRHTRFVCRANRGAGNLAGADNVLTWQTGYPFAVNLGRGYPRFNPGEYTATDILARGEADAALIVANDSLSVLEEGAAQHLQSIPYVALHHKQCATMEKAEVAFTVAAYGICTGGTVYRMDEVPIPLRPAIRSSLPGAEEILAALEHRVRELQAERRGLAALG